MNSVVRTLSSIALLAAAACGGTSEEPSKGTTEAAQQGQGAEGSGGVTPPTYRINCDGSTTFVNEEEHRKYAESSGKGDAPPAPQFQEESERAARCAPVDVSYRLPAPLCVSHDFFVWSGTTCVAKPSSSAEGEAFVTGSASKVFATSDACLSAHADCNK